MNTSRLFATAALVAAGAFSVGAARANEPSLQWSVTIGSPFAALPVPTFVRPAPVVVHPAPVYQAHYDRQPTRWDSDGDGIPNRYDRLYNPSWDRDGDGIPNARDRFDNRRFDRDRDGIPNRHDRH